MGFGFEGSDGFGGGSCDCGRASGTNAEEVLDLIEVATVAVVVEETAYRGRYLHFRIVHMKRRTKVVVLKAACWGTLEA